MVPGTYIMATMTAPALLIGQERIPCEIRLSPRRRTLSIEVHTDLRIIVRAPGHCPQGVISAWLVERTLWIGRQLDRFRRDGRERQSPPQYRSGETHLYLGKPCRLEVREARREPVTLVAGELRITTPPGAGPDRTRRLLEAWYRQRAHEVFGEVLADRFRAFRQRGHSCPTLAIRKMTSRWGSLADRRHMTLNLALIRAPRECIEYVVAHELCHLEHRGHGRGFCRLMDELMPDWRARKRRLNQVPVFLVTGLTGGS